MTLVFYNIFLLLYGASIRVASLLNPKARLWTKGRKNIFQRLNAELHPDSYRDPNSKPIWFHCSSLGEFEQGRPVIEKLKSRFPNSKILLTFFSPSGYEIRKDYKGADWIFYLPLDSKSNAKRFLDIVNPSLVVFVKYDYWFYYLAECKTRNIPLLMISAIFRDDQMFFKWPGSLHRNMLKCFTHFFVQDNKSVELLRSIHVNSVTLAGDTRFDRVAGIAENSRPIHEIERFCGNSQVLVAGSTWPDDEKMIRKAVNDFPDLTLIIAPHEIHKEHLDELKKLFPTSTLYSQLTPDSYRDHHSLPIAIGSTTNKCLIIDNIGMLSRLYHYASFTYIGGGFNKGIHNTLEAAVYGKPVFFGPKYQKFMEAKELIRVGGGFSVNSAGELSSLLKKLINDRSGLEAINKSSFEFVKQNRGATEKIIGYIEENRLLTN